MGDIFGSDRILPEQVTQYIIDFRWANCESHIIFSTRYWYLYKLRDDQLLVGVIAGCIVQTPMLVFNISTAYNAGSMARYN